MRKHTAVLNQDEANILAESYNVVTLNSGARLLKMLEKQHPDLILLDIEMPEMSGYETISHIKSNENQKHIPIIFLTAQNDTENEFKGLTLGAVDYIIKPFSPPLLLKRIEIHLLVELQKQKLIKFNANLQEMVDEKTKTVVELQNAVLKTMAELVEYRDENTGSHVEATQGYFCILVKALLKSGLHRKEVLSWDIELILHSAQLHDVGKIAIEDSILRKPSKLTPEEFEKIKVHTVFGETVIEKIKKDTSDHAFLEQARILAVTHHEKWDGSGYPYGLKGEEIPLQGRLLAIADVYEALVSERPYKKAFTHEDAVEIIKKDSGTHFDPTLVELFLGVSHELKGAIVKKPK
jgi:putative two-component system response regulator